MAVSTLTLVSSTFPILDQSAFLKKFDATYKGLKPSDDPMWCAMVNVVLAIGCRATPQSSEDQICGLFQNALGQLSWIMLAYISKVQTLMLMVRKSH